MSIEHKMSFLCLNHMEFPLDYDAQMLSDLPLQFLPCPKPPQNFEDLDVLATIAGPH